MQSLNFRFHNCFASWVLKAFKRKLNTNFCSTPVNLDFICDIFVHLWNRTKHKVCRGNISSCKGNPDCKITRQLTFHEHDTDYKKCVYRRIINKFFQNTKIDNNYENICYENLTFFRFNKQNCESESSLFYMTY